MAFFRTKSRPPEDRGPPAESTSEVVTDPAEVRAILEDAAQKLVPALLVSHDLAALCRARVAEFRDDTVVFNLVREEGPRAPRFRSSSMCSVSFHQGSRARVFLARVRSAHDSRVLLWRPTHIAVDDARMAFRVPVLPHVELKVSVGLTEFRPWTVTALDVSLAGVLVELPPEALGQMDIDTQVIVTLELEGRSVKVPGVVRRRHERRYAIFFPHVVDGNAALKPPEALRKLVHELQQAWLRDRSRV